MAKFGVTMQRTASATLAVGSLTAAAASMRRAKVYDLIFGCEATANDFAFLWQVQRCTTAGTASAATMNSLDSADTLATTIVGGQVHTVDPTGTTVLLSVAVNQRSTFRWVAGPYGELIIPATASNGIKIETPTAGALVAITACACFEEQ